MTTWISLAGAGNLLRPGMRGPCRRLAHRAVDPASARTGASPGPGRDSPACQPRHTGRSVPCGMSLLGLGADGEGPSCWPSGGSDPRWPQARRGYGGARRSGSPPAGLWELGRGASSGMRAIASAVLCFACNRPSVLTDTNTRRIARRVLGEAPRQPDWRLRLSLHELGGPRGSDIQWNQSLLDVGALVCRARAPRCGECPVRSHCATGRVRD